MVVSRGVALLLSYIVVLPLAALAADLGERQLEVVDVPAGPLREGSGFTYDVSVLSDFLGQATTGNDTLTIAIGELTFDAAGRPLFVVTTTRGDAPWDLRSRMAWEQTKVRTDGFYSFEMHEKVAVSAGRTIHALWSIEEEQHYRVGDSGYEYSYKNERDIWGGTPVGTVAAIAEYASETWRFEPDDRLLGDDRSSEISRAALDGRTLYAKTTKSVEEGLGKHFGCEMELPPTRHVEWAASIQHAGSIVRVEETLTTWRDPALPVPTVVDCHAAYALDGKDMGHIHVVAVLSEHEPGGHTIDVDWNEEPYGRPSGDLISQPTQGPGVPADGGSAEGVLRFPLSAAWAALESWNEPGLGSFASNADPPYVLSRAQYWPGEVVEVCDLPTDRADTCEGLDALDLLTGLDAPRGLNVRPHWEIVLENAERREMALLVVRNMTTSGQTIEDTVEPLWTEQVPTAAVSSYTNKPGRLVPIETMFEHWLTQWGHTHEEWASRPDSWILYHLRQHGDPEPTYQIWHAGEERPGGAKSHGLGAPGETGGHSMYRATDGALLESAMQAFLIKEEPPQVAGTPPAAEYQLPASYPPGRTAAIIVAVAVTVGFAGFHFSDTLRIWLRRLAALPLFTKLSRDRMLEHRTRESMVQYIEANPGIGTEDVRRHHDIGWGTAVYHLNALEEKGLLVSLKQGGARHWFCPRSQDRRAMTAHAILRSPASKRAYDAIAAREGLTQQELAADLGVTHGAVIFQVRKLVQAGLVQKKREGRFVRYYLGDAGARLVPN